MLDLVLAAYLVVLLPSYQLWRSLRRASRTPVSGAQRYLLTIAIALTSTAAVAALWLADGRSWTALGFGLPMAGGLGLGVAVVALAVMGILMRRQMTAAARPPKIPDGLLPTTPKERAMFLVMGLVVGAAWEILYRGYLLWVLAPRLGTLLAVLVAAAAYGAAHGYKNPKQFAGSMASALVFTTAYAVSNSLWWLMLIHAGLPVLMVIAGVGETPPTEADVAAAETA